MALGLHHQPALPMAPTRLQAGGPWTQRLVLISAFRAHSHAQLVPHCTSAHFPDFQCQARPGAACLPSLSLESPFPCRLLCDFGFPSRLTVPGTEMA